MSLSAADYPILVVDDDRSDFEAIEYAFQKARVANPLYYCVDGVDALDFLYQRGKYAEPGVAPRPSIILLDLNMPGIDGRSVLRQIKNDPALKTIPAIVMTNSTDQPDIDACYAAGANSYIQKPFTSQGYLEAVQRLEEYWFHIVILPRNS